MKTEMARQGALDGVAKFDKTNLKDVETQEKNPLPDNEGNDPHYSNFKTAFCIVFKNVQPSGNSITEKKNFFFLAIVAEKKHEDFKAGIEGFQKDKLSKAETVEKNTLPTKEVIEQEKTA